MEAPAQLMKMAQTQVVSAFAGQDHVGNSFMAAPGG
jgi:hypothetical protein